MAGRPDGDVWNIVDNDVESQHYGRNFKFDFSYISSEEIKDVVEYSCAVTPQVRQTGNRLSGLAGTAYASLLA